MKNKPLSREFLLQRGFCCGNGCLNCPYMKSPKTKQDLIETVMEQLKIDIHCGEVEAIEELISFLPNVNLIEYLPEEDWKQFKHLRDEELEIRTENALTNLIRMCPNDMSLGAEIRKRWQKKEN